MWTAKYIFSQICVVIAVSIFISTAYIKNRKTVVFLNCLVNLLYAVQYILLSKYTGVIINAIGIIRCIWFYFNAKREKKDYISLIVCLLLVISGGIFTFSSWVDIFAIIGSVIFTYGLWQPNLMFYRFSAIANHLSFIVYNIFCQAYVALAFEGVIIILTTISIIKFYVEGKKKNNKIISENDKNQAKNSEFSKNK
ncbi:MAG: YgjV family protein [Clostridia bacterium]|nr:YgjV family protein [Clostridia bacterium]